MQYNFEWDSQKAKENLKKHKVSFEQAATVLNDPSALSVYDIDHSETEDRWLTLGLSSSGNLLVVCHTFEKIDNQNTMIRIISCRKATKVEKTQYEI
ncbi:MAG: BrnT family toxin [SAR324 cluster bacterium]|nr:BrnT family toxin [SAR324 cluster bacterium]